MSTDTIALRGPHQARPIRFAGVHDVAGWRVKLYAIATAGNTTRPELLDAALATAADVLPQPPATDEHHGLAFVVAHDARDYAFVLVNWWQGENEIFQHTFSAPLDDPTALAPLASDAIGCVWELAPIDHERRAWLRHVLANPAGPDIDAYFEDHLEDDI